MFASAFFTSRADYYNCNSARRTILDSFPQQYKWDGEDPVPTKLVHGIVKKARVVLAQQLSKPAIRTEVRQLLVTFDQHSAHISTKQTSHPRYHKLPPGKARW